MYGDHPVTQPLQFTYCLVRIYSLILHNAAKYTHKTLTNYIFAHDMKVNVQCT